jgi:hypothetical protein
MHQHECNILNQFTYLKTIYVVFLYYISCKENNCWKKFEIMGKSLFNCSFYSHPEIRKFQGVTAYLVQIRVLVQTMETLI